MINQTGIRETLDHAVYIRLREMIINQEFKPGERIVQNQLTEKLGVSRTPLRKAMAELEMEGLLERTSKGWFAKEVSMKDMISIFEIRAVMEGLACRMIAPVIGKAEIAYMRALFDEAYEKFTSGDTEAYYQADRNFHQRIVELTNDALVKKTIESCRVIATSLTQGLYRSPEDTYQEHLDIIGALEQRDSDLAESLMREHIRKALPLLRSGEYKIYK